MFFRLKNAFSTQKLSILLKIRNWKSREWFTSYGFADFDWHRIRQFGSYQPRSSSLKAFDSKDIFKIVSFRIVNNSRELATKVYEF